METENKVEVKKYYDNPVQIQEGYDFYGRLLFRRVNGSDLPVPGEIIMKCRSISYLKMMTQEEIKKMYGPLKR